ncbi:hypothetical protein [Bowdeniella nasicola]|uniref:hypothetical protein n=1 Tax=Bowdeniella nasicola TaxID=208480 RepID=UPI0011614A39|nr:hypothetical protein [Bowdeniella nasicola]
MTIVINEGDNHFDGRSSSAAIDKPTLSSRSRWPGRTVLPALIGIALGCAVGFLATVKLGHPAPWSFTAGVAILTLIVTTLSVIPGALWAAHQDPVAVLRIS